MKHSHNTSQVSLFDFKKLGFNIPKDHHLVKLADSIDWDYIVSELSPLFSLCGRNSKSIRMMIGLEMAKTYLNESDEHIVSMLKTDVTVMYFCGFSSPLDISDLDSSSMTKFRNRLTPEVLQQINEQAVRTIVRKLPARKRSQVASDTTCLPANITYPTDTKLLSKTVGKMNTVIREVRSNGVKITVRGNRKIKKLIDHFNQKRKKTKIEIRKVKRLTINHLKRQLRSIKTQRHRLSEKSRKVVETTQEILRQQITMLKAGSNRTKDRIVSFHETAIRPIFRGKQNASTEFGKKVSLQVIGQRVILPGKVSSSNFSDTEVPKEDIAQFEEIFERPPKEYTFDRGGHSPGNHAELLEKNIHDGIEYRGRIPKKAKLPIEKKRKRMRNQRSAVEGKIGTLKTSYGLSKIPYKFSNTEVRWHIGIFLHNMKYFVST